MGRPGIVLYFDILPSLELLDYEQKGQLLEAIILYGREGNEPDFLDPLVEMAFRLMKRTIDRDGEAYELKIKKSKYSTYCREARKRNVDPIGIDLWLLMSEMEQAQLKEELYKINPENTKEELNKLSPEGIKWL